MAVDNGRYVPDNLTPVRDSTSPPRPRFMPFLSVPTGFYLSGSGRSALSSSRGPSGGGGSFGTGGPSGGGGSFGTPTWQRPQNNIDQNRLNRYFSSILSEQASGFEDDDEAGMAVEQFLSSRLGSTDARDAHSATEDRLLMELVIVGGNGIRGMLDRAIQWQLSEPDKFIALQMQLIQHGFLSEQPTLGSLDDATIGALEGMINGKRRVGKDQTLSEYLSDARDNWGKAMFNGMATDLAGVDAETADELKTLKEKLGSSEFEMVLTSTDTLDMAIQAQAAETLGRRLSASEVQTIIDSTHQKERDQWKKTDPDYLRYQELLKELTAAVSNTKERGNDVLKGQGPDDLDAFMNAILTQESGGDPDVVNADSGAFGLFQFMPATWKSSTRAAGLDPNDRSAENQKQVARFQMAAYFKMFGNWHDVAIAWYAGPGSSAIGDRSKGNKREGGGKYPSIQGYAEEITQRMRNGGQLDVDLTYAAADAGSLGAAAGGTAAGAPSQTDVLSWWETVKNIDLGTGKPREDLGAVLGEVGDTSRLAPKISEFESFDIGSFLADSVRESGGVDADAYAYAKQAQEFFSLLGAR